MKNRQDMLIQAKTAQEMVSGITRNQISYTLIVVLWAAGVLAYIVYLRRQLARRRKEEEAESAKRKRHRGKRCPQCKNIISARREVCQHCGYKFSEAEMKAATSSSEHHHHHSSSHHKKRRGKKCPQCQNVINYYRDVCQHCGYQFNSIPASNSGPANSSDSI